MAIMTIRHYLFSANKLAERAVSPLPKSMMSDLSLFYTFFCYRFKLFLIDEVDRDVVCEAVLRSLFNSNTRASGVGGAAPEVNLQRFIRHTKGHC